MYVAAIDSEIYSRSLIIRSKLILASLIFCHRGKKEKKGSGNGNRTEKIQQKSTYLGNIENILKVLLRWCKIIFLK